MVIKINTLYFYYISINSITKSLCTQQLMCGGSISHAHLILMLSTTYAHCENFSIFFREYWRIYFWRIFPTYSLKEYLYRSWYSLREYFDFQYSLKNIEIFKISPEEYRYLVKYSSENIYFFVVVKQWVKN